MAFSRILLAVGVTALLVLCAGPAAGMQWQKLPSSANIEDRRGARDPHFGVADQGYRPWDVQFLAASIAKERDFLIQLGKRAESGEFPFSAQRCPKTIITGYRKDFSRLKNKLQAVPDPRPYLAESLPEEQKKLSTLLAQINSGTVNACSGSYSGLRSSVGYVASSNQAKLDFLNKNYKEIYDLSLNLYGGMLDDFSTQKKVDGLNQRASADTREKPDCVKAMNRATRSLDVIMNNIFDCNKHLQELADHLDEYADKLTKLEKTCGASSKTK